MTSTLQESSPALRFLDTAQKQFEALATDRAHFPDWLQERQGFALNRFTELGFPNNRQEAWKYIDLRPVLAETYTAPHTPTQAQLDAVYDLVTQHPFAAVGSYITVVNGTVKTGLSRLDNLPEGITVTGFEQALSLPLARGSASDVLRVHVGQGLMDSDSDAHYDAFAALNLALATDGFLLHAAENISSDQPITVFVVSVGSQTQTQMVQVRGLVHAEGGAHLVVRMVLLSVCEPDLKPEEALPFLNNLTVETYVHEHAHIDLSYLQAPSPGLVSLPVTQTLSQEKGLKGAGLAVIQLAHTQAQVQGHGKLDISTVALCGTLSRFAIGVNYLGEHARAQLNGLSVLNKRQQVHHHTQVQHRLPLCETDQLYKGIISGEARLEFDGTITVLPDAQKTEANQVNRNLLLSDTARVWTRPQLRIDADDVKCTHGATVGQLNPDELFYCQTRGLSPTQAKNLLTLGFAKEVLNRMSSKQCPIQLVDAIKQALGDKG